MDSARALVAKGRGIALVSRTMGVSRAQLSLRINRSADWQDGRCNRRNDEADAEILSDTCYFPLSSDYTRMNVLRGSSFWFALLQNSSDGK